MNRSSRLYRHTAMLCVCITFFLGVGKAVAGKQQCELADSASRVPTPFTQIECDQWTSVPSQPFESLRCGDDSGDVALTLLVVLLCIGLLAAAAAPDEETT